MKFATYILLGVLIFAIFRTKRSVSTTTSAKERSVAIRTAATCWLLGFIFVLGLVFLPDKARVLMMLPAFFLTVSIRRAIQNARAQLRNAQAQQGQPVDLEKMKRVNPAS